MKSLYLCLIFIVLFLSGCLNSEIIQKREKELNEKISQLNCGDSIKINEMRYVYAVKRLRKSVNKTVFANKIYSVKKLDESVYILYGEDSLIVKIDRVFVGASHGARQEMLLRIKKNCQ